MDDLSARAPGPPNISAGTAFRWMDPEGVHHVYAIRILGWTDDGDRCTYERLWLGWDWSSGAPHPCNPTDPADWAKAERLTISASDMRALWKGRQPIYAAPSGNVWTLLPIRPGDYYYAATPLPTGTTKVWARDGDRLVAAVGQPSDLDALDHERPLNITRRGLRSSHLRLFEKARAFIPQGGRVVTFGCVVCWGKELGLGVVEVDQVWGELHHIGIMDGGGGYGTERRITAAGYDLPIVRAPGPLA